MRQGASKELNRCIHRAWGRKGMQGQRLLVLESCGSAACRVDCQEGSWTQLETATPAHAGPSARTADTGSVCRNVVSVWSP